METLVNSAYQVSVFGVILVRMRENMDQNNSQYGHFSRSASFYGIFHVKSEFSKISSVSLEENNQIL